MTAMTTERRSEDRLLHEMLDRRIAVLEDKIDKVLEYQTKQKGFLGAVMFIFAGIFTAGTELISYVLHRYS